MAENNQGSQGLEASQQPEATPREGDKQSLLLKLAERTVVQAEVLAQEITDNARQESEAEGAKLLAQYTEQAKSEANKAIESAKRRSETLLNDAVAEAQSESEKMLSKAQSESEKMLSRAQSDSEKMLSKAQSDSEEGLDKAQAQGREVLDRARQEALDITNASQTRADSAETDARLKAEFIIRQTTQNVSEGIRSAVLEICNNLLPIVDEFVKETPKALPANQADGAMTAETKLPENAASSETEANSSPPDPAHTDTDTQSSNKSSGGKARSSAKRRTATA